MRVRSAARDTRFRRWLQDSFARSTTLRNLEELG
jgi:hypothetical protein